MFDGMLIVSDVDGDVFIFGFGENGMLGNVEVNVDGSFIYIFNV